MIFESNKMIINALRVYILISLAVALSARATDRNTVNPGPLPNHAPPNVQLSPNLLEFSPSPTEEELFRAHVFGEPLVPVGGKPNASENADLAAALLSYSKRSSPDDFSSLTYFIDQHRSSPWNAALLTDLGLEYYNTAHYSKAIDAWTRAWALSKNASNGKAIAIVDRAFGELIQMQSRLGRMDELTNLLKSVESKHLMSPAAERTVLAREALWSMQNHPEISFRCGPLALRSIRLALNQAGTNDAEILKSASTQQGCSLPQVADLSKRIGLNYQMAFRQGGDFITPSVVHWKVGHFAALIRHGGDLYELQDPTFGNKSWATKAALEAETSGYFLVPPGPLPPGWRVVDEKEGGAVWGKGMTGANDPQHIAKNDLATGGTCPGSGIGMAVAKVHLMDVNLNLSDTPVGYAPPVGPPVFFTVRYNQRDVFQPANFNYGNLGPQWTSDWFAYITDNPTNTLADVNLYVGGGGQRTYIDFNSNTQSYNYQQYDHNLLTRTGPASYQLLSGDGSRMIFSKSDGSVGTSRNIFLTQVIDPQNNAVTLTYDTNFCLVAITDAIGQVTTLTYGLASTNVGSGQDSSTVPADPYKLTKVTDPFGRSATFTYQPQEVEIQYGFFNGQLIPLGTFYAWEGIASSTDVIGITSQFGYQSIGTPVNQFETLFTSYVNSLTTPYGTTTFFPGGSGNVRSLEIMYPDGSKERVEYNQTNLNQVMSDPVASLPAGMYLFNSNLRYRNSYYWDRNACAQAYGDYSKARMYHFLHKEDLATTSGALESMKMPLEGRVWYNYPGQNGLAYFIGSSTLPSAIGRVLDDGTTQLTQMENNSFGHLTNFVDPLGRSTTYIYDTNSIDLLEVRQTRGANNELLSKASYNSLHLPLTISDASGQTTTFTYNQRGQLLTATSPKSQTVVFSYDQNGYRTNIAGPLAGTNGINSFSFDAFGRPQTLTDYTGYQLRYAYDNLNRVTNITYPDGTSFKLGYNLLDLVFLTDRAGRQTALEYDNMRQLTKKTDPLGRITRFDWCRCGAPQSLIDPLGRITSWVTDIQGRTIAKQYPDGSKTSYIHENTTSRCREIVDAENQITSFTYTLDNSIGSINYGNSAVPTPGVNYTYDPNYLRITSMKDGIGTTTYSYVPITTPPSLGAGKVSNINGPLTNSLVSFTYDEDGRIAKELLDGDFASTSFDMAGRMSGISNALGAFNYAYDGGSVRLTSKSSPNGGVTTISYAGNLQDRALQQITHTVGVNPVSKFSYNHDIPHEQITTWSQQAGSQSPSTITFSYDAVDQLISAAVTNAGLAVNEFAYSYDLSGNRLSELAAGLNTTTSYNSLNQISAAADDAANIRTNEWDAANRLTAVNLGSNRTEFGYDGRSQLAYIRQLQNGSEISFRRFVTVKGQIREERDKAGAVITKRFFPQGVKFETGANAGAYYYTRDHLGSVRELVDAGGSVRARYAYDPFGRKTKISGDLDADFGFAAMFWSGEASLALTHFRAYDPALGRWLSRDPLQNAELMEGPNLYAYVGNRPGTRTDASGLAGTLPGLGFNTVTVTLLTLEVTDPEALPGFVEDLGLGAQNIVQQGGEAAADICAGGITEVMETAVPALENAAPEIESFPGMEIAEGVIVKGKDLEQWLVDDGQIGGNSTAPFGPDALDLLGQFSAQEQSYFDQLKGLLQTYNLDRNIIDYPTAARLAHKMAVDYFGYDTDFWNRLSSL